MGRNVPFPEKAVAERSKQIGKVLVVEMNTGQMVKDVKVNLDRGADIFYKRLTKLKRAWPSAPPRPMPR